MKCRLFSGVASALCLCIVPVLAQPTSRSPLAPPPNGPRSTELEMHVLRNATVHPDPDTTWESAVIEIDAGRIVRVVQSSDGYRAPAGAREHDCTGLHIYPGFIDAFVAIDAPELDESRPGAHWNPWVTPDRRVSASPGVSAETASNLRGLGFTAAAIAPDEGIFAGQGAVVSLGEAPGDKSSAFERLYADSVFHTLHFETGSWTTMRYPTSHPGAVALMRQTLSDAEYQARKGEPGDNALTPLEDPKGPFLLFDCERELEILLAADIAREFGREAVVVDNGLSFKWLDAIAETGMPVVVALRFPRKPDVSTPAKAEEIDLGDLMTWEHAPANAARLAHNGVRIALTASKLPKGAKFHEHLREAIAAGLSERDALAALTTTPADLLGVSDQVGRIAPGLRANLVVSSGPIFEKKSEIRAVWIDGRRHHIADADGPSLDGDWTIRAEDAGGLRFERTIRVSGTGGDGKAKAILLGTDASEADVRMLSVSDATISFVLDAVREGEAATILTGTLLPDGTLAGTGVSPDDTGFSWTARRTQTPAAQDKATDAAEAGGDKAERAEAPNDADAKEPIPDLPGYPFGPYAVAETPAQDTVLITGATVWTLDQRGRIENGWVLISGGKVQSVGDGAPPPVPSGGRTIDGAGMHVSPGIIDAHSHTSMFPLGVNEAGQTVTAEVRIGDAIDPSSVQWYRQLASGVTTVLSLHGSANPIGGQSQTTKVRWGARSPREMYFQGARPGIKFALGENVKRSNSTRDNDRYPTTRLGVDALIRDRLSAAREYGKARRSADPPRRDLELEALAEIVEGTRLIHCHSYRQDEILMLCRVAEDYGFTIGTFQHGLEVYKVAEAVREVARGASIFSDWWMYKVEVIDAIPFAGPLQTEVGVVTSYNSDSDELARRLNLEAAKAIRYCRTDEEGAPVISEVEALKFVTLNAAIQLDIADRVGSIEPGKDADLVVWTASPLSTAAIPAHVFVDGRELFSLEQDGAHRARIASERQRIIQKILGAPDKGRDKAPRGPETKQDEILASYYRDMLLRGEDPEAAQPGDCGCGIINHRLHVFMEKYDLLGAGGHDHDHHHGHDHDSHDH